MKLGNVRLDGLVGSWTAPSGVPVTDVPVTRHAGSFNSFLLFKLLDSTSRPSLAVRSTQTTKAFRGRGRCCLFWTRSFFSISKIRWPDRGDPGAIRIFLNSQAPLEACSRNVLPSPTGPGNCQKPPGAARSRQEPPGPPGITEEAYVPGTNPPGSSAASPSYSAVRHNCRPSTRTCAQR